MSSIINLNIFIVLCIICLLLASSFETFPCCHHLSKLCFATMAPPIALCLDILSRVWKVSQAEWIAAILMWCFEEGPEFSITLMHELNIENVLPILNDWEGAVRVGKQQLVQLGVQLGHKGALYYNSCRSIFRATDVGIHLTTLRMLSPDHLPSRFCLDVLTVFYNGNRSRSAIEDLGEWASDASVTEGMIHSLIDDLKRMQLAHRLFTPFAQANINHSRIPDACQGWRLRAPGHLNPQSWPPQMSDVKNYKCSKCAGLSILYIYCNYRL